MREKIEENFQNLKKQIVEINAKYSRKTKVIAAAILVIVIVLAFVITAILNNKEYATLFANLNDQEATEIMGKLQESQVDYKYEDGTILVPEDQEQELKATLVSEGYPKSGLTYDIFKNNVDLMSTDFEKNSYKIYDLQERLASTIRLFDNVKDATVTIAIGSDKKYVLEKDKVESSASVVVITEDGGSPSAEQVKGIQRLVAKSIPGMDMENVVIVDGDGMEVSTSENNTQEGSARLKLNLEKEIENSTKVKVLHLLRTIYGEDNVRVTVNATVDIDKKIKEITNYLPTTEDNKGIPSKEVTSQEVIGDKDEVGGIPGSETNADVPIYPGITTDGNEIYFKDEKALDYLVNQVKEQVESDSGVLTDLTVSVAVDSQDLTATKTAELKKLIAHAAGIDVNAADDKISIFNTAFYSEDKQEASSVWNDISDFVKESKYGKFILLGIILLLIIIIALAVIISKKRKKAKEETEEESLEEGVLSINVEDIKPTRESELRDEIRDFASNNPEISAQLIKSWLRGEEENE
ncbi:flagellar basal-body MS-ring/collar protein FliF [Anaerovorax odorimutans]|uniref:flagellar basal-body MS-ring/collar protein FliF n=1 Tax=Anaerovorax odorimutans TaxID=109327 RepID=UPI00041D86A7|nr:flagellar basal-body MS-ring/collar protein FliF [Anaerovorax odorimutans]